MLTAKQVEEIVNRLNAQQDISAKALFDKTFKERALEFYNAGLKEGKIHATPSRGTQEELGKIRSTCKERGENIDKLSKALDDNTVKINEMYAILTGAKVLKSSTKFIVIATITLASFIYAVKQIIDFFKK